MCGFIFDNSEIGEDGFIVYGKNDDIYVDVVKYWNDSMMKVDPEDPASSEYARKDIKIILHGEITCFAK